MLARLFVIVGGLFVLVLCAALVGPYFVDWTSYRADFEREASAILGRKVTVEGDATARLLPFPSVTFSDVSVAGGPDGQPAMTVETFSMDAELAPFLRGEVLIFDMRLVRPKATIDVAENGTVDWAIRPSSPFDFNQVAIENLAVTDGEIELRHRAGGRNYLLSDINSTISAKSLTGPWRMDGTLKLDGIGVRLAASTGRVEADGQMRLRLKLDPDAYPLAIESDGNAGMKDGAVVYSGQFRIAGNGSDKAELRGTDGRMVTVRAEPGYRVTGKFSLDHQKLGIDEFRFETGPLDNPYAADGKASVDLGTTPRFAIEASGAQVKFDEAVAGEAGGGLTLDQRIAALERALLSLPKPAIPGTVEVKLPAVLAGDTTIRDVYLSAEPATGGWTVKSLSATLPGRTTLEAKGLLGLDGKLGFKGSLLLAVAQPSGFAAWLSKDVDEAIRRLPAAGFKADVDLADTRQTFNSIELILGKAKFSGSIDSLQPPDARPSVQMKLSGNELDVEGLAAFASLFFSDRGANRFADRDLDFAIKAGPVTAGGLTAETLDTALRLHDGVLEVDRLSIGGLAGSSISATGRLKDFPKNPSGTLDASLVAVDVRPLVEAAAGQYPGNALLKGLAERAAAYPELLQDARVDLVAGVAANGDGSTGLALSARGEAGGTAFSASLSGQGTADQFATAPLSLTFDARNGDATALLALYGLPVLPLGLVGEGRTELSAKGTIAGGLATSFHLAGQDFNAGFEGEVGDTPQGPTIKGKASLEAADIEPWMMTVGLGLPGMGVGMAANFTADADYANGLLVLDGLSGALNEASVSGDVNVDVKDGLPHLAGALVLDELDLDPMAVTLFGTDAFMGKSGAKGGGWPTAPFSEKSAAPFTADLDVTTASLSAGAFATAYDATLALKLDREGIRVSGLKAKLFGGALSGAFELKNDGGTGLFSGQMALAATDLAQALPENGLAGRADVSAELTAGGKSVDAMVAALSGSGTVSLKGLTVAGFNPDAFPTLIERADAVGRDIDAAKVAAFAPQVVAEGAFTAQDTELAFTVANGVVRAPPIALTDKTATLSADLAADLGAATVTARGSVAYKPGDEALVGSEPVVNFSLEGPLGATKRAFDSQPLGQFLTQRALEKEQRRVEAMQAELLEKQRLRREVRYYSDLQAARAERKRLDDLRVKAEAEARVRAVADYKAKQEAEAAAKAKAEEEARLAAEQAAKAEAEKEAARMRQEAAAAEQAKADAERRKAEQAARAAQEKAKAEAERRASGQVPEIERAPLPPATANPAPAQTAPAQAVPAKPAPKPDVFSIDNLLKSLGGG
ncbi:MAG: AsmA family protein [Mesorhizobium sp.]